MAIMLSDAEKQALALLCMKQNDLSNLSVAATVDMYISIKNEISDYAKSCQPAGHKQKVSY